MQSTETLPSLNSLISFPKNITHRVAFVALYVVFFATLKSSVTQFVELFRNENALYYTFEYSALSDAVEKHTTPDFEKGRGWRRGPAGNLWLLPLAHIYGKDLPPGFIYSLQIVVAILCICLTLLIFGKPSRYLWEIPAYATLWLSSTSFKYRLELGDINSLFSFCFFPFLSMFFLTRGQLAAAGVAIATGAHFRILSVGQAIYFSLRNRRTFVAVILASIVILLLGSIFIGPYQGYLYWWRLVGDVAFKGSGVQSAAAAWHENISVAGVFTKFAAHFNYGSGFNAVLSEEAFKVCMRLAALVQLAFGISLLVFLWKNLVFDKEHKRSPELRKELLLIELGIASLFTYFVTPEYGNDFLVTLMPLFCAGLHQVITRWNSISLFWKATFGVAWLLTYNLFGTAFFCRILPLQQWGKMAGNQIAFGCYELYNIFLLPIIGIALATLFLIVRWKELRAYGSR